MTFLICIAQPTFDLDDQLDLVSIFNLHVLKLLDEDRGLKLLPLCKTDGIFCEGSYMKTIVMYLLISRRHFFVRDPT